MTWGSELLEFTLNASQAALVAAEGEANVVRAQLAKSDTRVASKILKELYSFGAFILLVF